MAIREKLYTAADLWALSHLPENDGKRLELIEGVIYEMSPAGGKHGWITGNIHTSIWQHVRDQYLGFVTAAETGYNLTGDSRNVLAPDVGFVKKERLRELPEGFIPLAPDLAVEVLSPGQENSYIDRKGQQYLDAGTEQVWMFDPATKRVIVDIPAGKRSFEIEDTLDGGDLLPGFSLRVRDVFPA